jgi:hypothetical protein
VLFLLRINWIGVEQKGEAIDRRQEDRRKGERRAQDRRKHSRFPANIVLDLYEPGSDMMIGKGYIVDISLGGAAMETGLNLGESAEIYMRFNLPPSVIGARGIIVRKTQLMNNLYRYGVRYSGMNIFRRLRLRRRINSWIKRNT